MKQLLQSGSVVIMLIVLTVLTVVNTCQLDSLEEKVLETRKALRELSQTGVAVRGAGTAGAGGAMTGDPEQAAALADPANILKPNPRPYVKATQVARGGTLRRQEGSDPPGMNIYLSNYTADLAEFTAYMQNTLATRQIEDPDLWMPELAIKVTTPDDGLTYEVTLRKGVMWYQPVVDWASGRFDWLKGEHEVTSDDFAFVFEVLRNPQVSGGGISAMRPYFEALDRWEVIDRYRFRVHFKQRIFTNLSSVLGLNPLPRWLFMYDQDGKKLDDATWGLKLNEHWYNQKMIGTGPYRFVEWVPGVRIVMERNERYWGEAPAFDKVLTLIIKDQDAWPRRLKAKDLDYTHLQPEQYRTVVLEAKGPVLGDQRLKRGRHSELSYFFVAWNQDTPYFSDKRVRQAMTMALDRERLVKNVFNGLGRLHTGPFAQDNPCYDRGIAPWPYDLKAAAAKLDEAGWRDTDGDGIRDKVVGGRKIPFEFSMITYGSSNEWSTVANIYREALLQIGVRMHPRPLEWSTMLKKMDEKEFGAYSGGWALSWDTDLMQVWHSKEADIPKSSNRIGFRNKEADRIAESLRKEFDPQKRVQLCHSFHALVHEEQPYSFIYQRDREVLYWDHMNELEFSQLYPHRNILLFSFREARP
jgi:peptide/nickel transport system substrate-binding protein